MRVLNSYQRSKLDAAFRRAYREDDRAARKSRCAYCADHITSQTATADHVKARAVSGLDHRNNIVAACETCNVLKGKMPVAEFRKLLNRPRSGGDIRFWLAWSRRRINLRIDRMAENLGVGIL